METKVVYLQAWLYYSKLNGARLLQLQQRAERNSQRKTKTKTKTNEQNHKKLTL